MAELTDDSARGLGIRIISPDRPGIADSTGPAERCLLDWPPLLREFADFLGLSQFRVLAISGGAPYAYASGWALPDRVKAMAVVSGAPHIAELPDHGELWLIYRLMLAANKRLPRLSRWGFRFARPLLSLRPPQRSRPFILSFLRTTDASSLRDSAAFEACFDSQRRAWEKSTEGVLADAQIYAAPWGFSLRDVRVPVRLWHGDADRSFSLALAQHTARQLPNCQTHFIPGAGHYSTPIVHMREILADLIGC